MDFMTIAIDGPAASGKSTAAEKLALQLGFLYFDTGVMYRAATLAALLKFGTVDSEVNISELSRKIVIDVQPTTVEDGRKFDVLLDGKDVTWEIRSLEVERNVSKVSAYPVVREELTKRQRVIGERGNVVMVGRDIGTVVMPDADYKFYIDASPEVRAKRRCDERINRGETVDYEKTLADIRRRDQIDSTRKVAPLVPADDAIHIMTDELTREQVVDEMLAYIDKN